jgi:hypothetical protein
MECLKSTRAISALLDPAESEREEVREMARHVGSCQSCSDTVSEFQDLREELRSLPAREPSAEVMIALRVVASRERARRLARLSYSSAFAAWRNRVHLTLTNLMQPLALPVAGGLASALLLFACLAPDLVFELHPVKCDVPTSLFTAARLKDVSWPTIGDAEIVVDVNVDDQGRFTDYSIVSGASLLRDETLRRRFESSLLLTQFTPATAFGMPTPGRTRVFFHSSRIDIKG